MPVQSQRSLIRGDNSKVLTYKDFKILSDFKHIQKTLDQQEMEMIQSKTQDEDTILRNQGQFYTNTLSEIIRLIPHGQVDLLSTMRRVSDGVQRSFKQHQLRINNLNMMTSHQQMKLKSENKEVTQQFEEYKRHNDLNEYFTQNLDKSTRERVLKDVEELMVGDDILEYDTRVLEKIKISGATWQLNEIYDNYQTTLQKRVSLISQNSITMDQSAQNEFLSSTVYNEELDIQLKSHYNFAVSETAKKIVARLMALYKKQTAEKYCQTTTLDEFAEQFEQEIRGLQRDLKEQEKQKEWIQTDIDFMNKKLKDLMKEKEKYTQEILDLNEKFNTNQDLYEQMGNENILLRKAIGGLQKKNQVLQESNDEKDRIIKQIKDQYQGLNESNSDILQQVASSSFQGALMNTNNINISSQDSSPNRMNLVSYNQDEGFSGNDTTAKNIQQQSNANSSPQNSVRRQAKQGSILSGVPGQSQIGSSTLQYVQQQSDSELSNSKVAGQQLTQNSTSAFNNTKTTIQDQGTLMMKLHESKNQENQSNAIAFPDKKVTVTGSVKKETNHRRLDYNNVANSDSKNQSLEKMKDQRNRKEESKSKLKKNNNSTSSQVKDIRVIKRNPIHQNENGSQDNHGQSIEETQDDDYSNHKSQTTLMMDQCLSDPKFLPIKPNQEKKSHKVQVVSNNRNMMNIGAEKKSWNEACQTEGKEYIMYMADLFHNELRESIEEQLNIEQDEQLKQILIRSRHLIDRIKFKAAQGDLFYQPLQNSHMYATNSFKTQQNSESPMSKHFNTNNTKRQHHNDSIVQELMAMDICNKQIDSHVNKVVVKYSVGGNPNQVGHETAVASTYRSGQHQQFGKKQL